MGTYKKSKIIPENIKWEKINTYLFYLFILLYVFFLLFLCNKLNIWEDETYSLNTSANSLSKVISLSYHFEEQPPFYFVLLTLWRKINDGIFFARLLSVIFTLLSAFVLNKLLRLIFKKNYSKWVIVLFLLNPYTVWASQEIRLYSLLVLLSLQATYLFYLIYQNNRLWHKILFGLICLCGVYTQYYFTILIASFSLIILISKGWRSFFSFCLLCLPIVLLFVPNLYFIKDQILVNQDNIIETFSPITRIKSVMTTFQHFFFTDDISNQKLIRWTSRLLIGFLLTNSIYKLYYADLRNNSNDLKSFFEIYSALLAISAFFILLVILLPGLIYSDKYLTIVFPLICLLYASFNVYNKALKRIIYLIFSLFFFISLMNNYKDPFVKDFDYNALVKFLQKPEHQNEPIIFYNKALAFTLSYYYDGKNLKNPMRDYISDHIYYNTKMDTIGVIQSIKNETARSKSILFVTVVLPENADSLLQKRYSSEDYLQKNYKNCLDTIISGKFGNAKLRIRRLSKLETFIP